MQYFALAMIFVIATGCSSGPEPGVARAAPEKPQNVATVKAERMDLSRSAELTASFRPWQEVEVHAKVAGYLKNITVDVGDRVRRGHVIATLEVPEFEEELAHAVATERRTELDVVRARSEVKRAQTALDIRKLSYERLLGVSKTRPNLIARQEIDTAASRYQEAEAQLMTAKAALAAAEQQVNVAGTTRSRVSTMMSYLQIAAPFNGVITRRYADPGALIQAGTASQTQAMPLVRISQVDRLRMVLPVPESLVSRVRPGTPVEIRVDSLQRVFQGKVTRLTGRLNPATRTMETEVDVPNPGGTLIPGMYGYATLLLERRADTLAVPVQAISGRSSTPTVLVVENGRIQERAVKLGLETPEMVEIASGLQEGDLVVIGNRTGLRPGRTVQAKPLAVAELRGN